MKPRHRRRRRKGNVLALTAFMIVALFAVLACAVDYGYLQVARTELQRSADAAAIAAAWDLIDEDALNGQGFPCYLETNARNTAAQYAQLNAVATVGPGLAYDDVRVGYFINPLDPAAELLLDGLQPANAVQVRVRRTAAQNGEVPLFFARALGRDQAARDAQATAALINNFIGFQPPSSGDNLGFLPFALDVDTWNALLNGVGADNWTWERDEREVFTGSDGILEVNLYPEGSGELPPGNRGTVDIGSDNNSTNDISRQIVYGLNEEDLAYHGGTLQLNEAGVLMLNGDTGISAGVKDELASIIGRPRTILLFSDVAGPGNNAMYTIVGFAGVRIMEVKLTGSMSNKRVVIQPANVLTLGGIPATEGQRSYFIYSPPWLVR